MDEMDIYSETNGIDQEEELFLNFVVQGDHELLYLDTCLREILGR